MAIRTGHTLHLRAQGMHEARDEKAVESREENGLQSAMAWLSGMSKLNNMPLGLNDDRLADARMVEISAGGKGYQKAMV